MTDKPLRLGVNIDHVATVRNARGGGYPDPLRAARIALASMSVAMIGAGAAGRRTFFASRRSACHASAG